MAGRKISIKSARKSMGLSARKLGNIIGCTEETIYKYEKMHNPDLIKESVKLDLCNALNVSYEKLFHVNLDITYDLRPNTTKLEIARKKARMSRTELANMLGVTRQTIYNFENKKCAPSIPMAIKICEIFNCTLDELFWNDWENTEKET